MQQPTNEPVHRLSRDEWWESVREALDDLDPEQAASYQAENRRLEAAAADGLSRGQGPRSAAATTAMPSERR